MKNIEKITGIAENVRIDATLQGVGGNSVQTMYLCTFNLNGGKMQFRTNVPIFIDVNDKVEVSGWLENGVFQIQAYKNKTQEINEFGGYSRLMGIGAVFTIIGVMMGIALAELGIMSLAISGIAVCIGVYIMSCASDGLKAVRLLN